MPSPFATGRVPNDTPCFQSSTSARQAPTVLASSQPLSKPTQRVSDYWIIQYHDAWSRLTLNAFYQDLNNRSLSATQYARWLVDRTTISLAVVKAATRASLIAHDNTLLPLVRIAEEDAQFLAEFATLNGFDINSKLPLSHAAKQLVELIETCTAPDSTAVVAITAVWCYMFASWQAWALFCHRRGEAVTPPFDRIASHISREDSITQLVATQDELDKLLFSCSQQEYQKAGKTFEDISRRSSAVLDDALHYGENNRIPLCVCGRKGHVPAQCTFKSHI